MVEVGLGQVRPYQLCYVMTSYRYLITYHFYELCYDVMTYVMALNL